MEPAPNSLTRKLHIPTRAATQLGQALRRCRLKANLTQGALAKSAGLRQATVSKVETGVGTTEIRTIYALCAALGLDLVLQSRSTSSRFRPEDFPENHPRDLKDSKGKR